MKTLPKFVTRRLPKQRGFTIVELVLACVIFPMVVVGIATAVNGIQYSYTTARELNEMYAVLSACPEVDRALEFTSLSSGTNCYPNNSFVVENQTGTKQVTYSPTLTVTDTSALSGSDPLQPIPDSKVVQIQVNFVAPAASNTPLQLRMLITRNGIGQL
ncbi:MAG TPA: type II secretion system protein [Candidatus Pristimantibacillus sp.]|nr:type II secretion system protein [Candidatus Pristimantibacillus sp.]